MSPFASLPLHLLVLLHATIVLAQQRQELALESLSTFIPTTSTSYVFTFPSAEILSVSIALCSSAAAPSFAFTNATGDQEGGDFITLTQGLGLWSGPARDGAVLTVADGTTPFQVGVSINGPRHATLGLDAIPLLGDTTANQALLFSPPFDITQDPEPTFPQYTLPEANNSQPSPPATVPRMTSVLFRTESAPGADASRTGCALATVVDGQDNVGDIQSQGLWRRGSEGWREEWLIGGLSPQTNYTAYVIVDDTKVAGPMQFTTKSASFSCALLHQLPFCPRVAWSVPLQAPPPPLGAHDASSLPPSISSPLLEYLTNFTIALTTMACGRDIYSPLQTCASCQVAYRTWLCAVQFPRCAENPVGPTPATLKPALAVQTAGQKPRNEKMEPKRESWNELLPCLETCHAVDRACPSFLKFTCPVPQFNANVSYGVGFVDGDGEDGQGKGSTGVTQDRWGNVWCNSG